MLGEVAFSLPMRRAPMSPDVSRRALGLRMIFPLTGEALRLVSSPFCFRDRTLPN